MQAWRPAERRVRETPPRPQTVLRPRTEGSLGPREGRSRRGSTEKTRSRRGRGGAGGRVAATRSRRAPPAPPRPGPGLCGFPETLGDASALVGVADAVEVLREEKPDLRKGLEDGALAVEQRKAHARQLLPLALEHRVQAREARVELLALLDGALDDRRDQAVDGLLGARGALGGRLGQRHDRHAELSEEALEQASHRILEQDRRQPHPLHRVVPQPFHVRIELGLEPLDVLAVLLVLPPVADHALAEIADHRVVPVALHYLLGDAPAG